jgi:hypothetical protein
MATQAAIVDSGTVNIVIPDTADGLYFNVVTGASGTTPATAPAGWDINPYSALAGQWNLWGATANTWFNPQAVITGNYNLPLATVIQGANAAFFRPGGGTNLASQVNLNSNNNYFGFRFTNEAGGTNHFGFIQVQFGATAATRSIVRYVFESTPDTAVTVAGPLLPLTSTPATGSTVTFPPRSVGGPASTGSVTFNNPRATAAAVTCAISGAGAAAFSSTGLTPSVPAAGSASVPLSYTSATAGTATATLTCTSGAQTFTFTLSGTTSAAAPAAVSVPVFHGKGLLAMLALVFGFGLATLLVRRN